VFRAVPPERQLRRPVIAFRLRYACAYARRAFGARPGAGRALGDLFMSLIHTCELNGVNPFDYLTELQRHAKELRQNPSE
jgi:hypothetical protein